MTARLDFATAQPELFRKFAAAAQALEAAGFDHALLHLVYTRASQLNGCAFCLDVHAKDAFAVGEDPLRLIALDAWEESPLFTPRERAALAWTEALTRLDQGHVSDDVFAAVRPHFDDAELATLSMAIGQINFWNRLAVAFRTPPGARDALLEPLREAKRRARAGVS